MKGLELRNIKLVISYDGTAYCGWQKQLNQLSIQEVVEKDISRMTSESPVLHGAGRTDAGVHAYGMVANFHTNTTIPCDGFLKGLNSMLPKDIRIMHAVEAAPDFHARFSAMGKTYIYYLDNSPVQDPSERLYVYHVKTPLDLAAMKNCLTFIQGEHDFATFEAKGSRDLENPGKRGSVRRIFSATLNQNKQHPNKITIEITGDGFLRHMVRNIVSTLIETGKGVKTVAAFEDALVSKDRLKCGPTAPAHGLYLKKIYYEKDCFPQRKNVDDSTCKMIETV